MSSQFLPDLTGNMKSPISAIATQAYVLHVLPRRSATLHSLVQNNFIKHTPTLLSVSRQH